MSFITSSKDLRLNGSTLYARCKNGAGQYVDSSCDLNNHFGNKDGYFWGGDNATGFYSSAKDVRLDNTVLIANLARKNGSWNDSQIDLNRFFRNDNGKLVALGYGMSANDEFKDEWNKKPLLGHVTDAFETTFDEIKKIF